MNTLSPEQKFLSEYQKLTQEQINSIYSVKSVEAHKVEVLKAFTVALINQIYDTFLGNDAINNERDIASHYRWCYAVTAEAFKGRYYRFDQNPLLEEYFHGYFVENIYAVEESRDVDMEYYDFLLDYQSPKEKYKIKSFLELYEIFSQTPRSGRQLLK
jgi:hypothetical protein